MEVPWFDSLLEDVELSTTIQIGKQFPRSRFMVLSQEDSRDYITRKIAFVLGPYILCKAINKVKKNSLVEEWIKNNPHRPFGEIFKNNRIKRQLITKTKSSRRFIITGEINAEIEEEFFKFRSFSIAAFCGKVHNSEKDLKIAKKFSNINSDIHVFPESYPYSRAEIMDVKFPDGTIFGRYYKTGPETFFVDKQILKVEKYTLFANEKLTLKKNVRPLILNFRGVKIAVLICYDLLNPKLSYDLAKEEVDLILVPSMIPEKDISRWINFMYVRGQENQCPIVLVSNKDKRNICAKVILFFDPIKECVSKYSSPRVFSLKIGGRMLESPKVHWSWLLKNKVYGPFTRDF